MPFSRDLLLLYVAAFLRSLGVGLLGVLLGIYLFRHGFSSAAIGFVIAAGLAGAAVATVIVTIYGDRAGRRRVLVVLALLGSLAGFGLAGISSLAPLLPLAFLGMLNGMGTDRGAALAMEQAIIPGLIPDRHRTWALSWYNVLLDGGGALGALAAGLPVALERWRHVDLALAYRAIFLGYAALSLLSSVLYLLLSDRVEAVRRGGAEIPAALAPETKRLVTKLASLFSLDALGGGFLTDALVSYWFFRRFGIAEQQLAMLFSAVHILNATSHLGAAWLARRIGLVNTMVFTHMPSSLLLIAVPFAPTFRLAAVFFLMRESLVEMDVPTRQSYVAAVVRPHERTFASGVTNLSRNVFWAVSASVAGLFMQHVAFSAPVVLGGTLKIGYDCLLYRAFHRLKPPEEMATRSADPC